MHVQYSHRVGYNFYYNLMVHPHARSLLINIDVFFCSKVSVFLNGLVLRANLVSSTGQKTIF